MTHNVHPYAFRLGIIRDWKSRWFNTKEYKTLLRVDTLLREWLLARTKGMMVEGIHMERGPREFKIVIRSTRPGLIIGRGGEGIEKLKKDAEAKLIAIVGSKPTYAMRLTVEEVENPEANASIVAQMVAQDLERRLPFRRTLKTHIAKVFAARGVEGVKIKLSGRLDGAEMGRVEWLKEGRIPLQTLRADIDFARERAVLPYGTIGVKVWIYRGQIFERDRKAAEERAMANAQKNS